MIYLSKVGPVPFQNIRGSAPEINSEKERYVQDKYLECYHNLPEEGMNNLLYID